MGLQLEPEWSCANLGQLKTQNLVFTSLKVERVLITPAPQFPQMETFHLSGRLIFFILKIKNK